MGAAAPEDDREPNAALLGECRAAYDAWSRFVTSRSGLIFMFVWAAAEATVWPIIPDFLLVPMAIGARRRFYVPLLAGIAGMAIGGSTTVLAASLDPHQVSTWLRHLPFVTEAQIRGAHSRLARDGISAFWFQPWSGISFRVWAVEAGSMHLNAALAIPVFVVARGIRMSIFAAAAGLLAHWLRGFIRDFFLFLLIVYGALFLYGWWQVMSATGLAFSALTDAPRIFTQ